MSQPAQPRRAPLPAAVPAPCEYALPAVEYTLSNLQQGISGLASAALGVGLIVKPTETVALLAPVTQYLEGLLGLAALKTAGAEPFLALIGTLHVLLGYYAVMSVYTCDEKFKRNSVPGRFAFGLACVYVCQKTPHGTSFTAFLGLTAVVPAILLAMLVGIGDGNAVDIERMEKEWKAEQKKLKAT